jgi:hypothetical protein
VALGGPHVLRRDQDSKDVANPAHQIAADFAVVIVLNPPRLLPENKRGKAPNSYLHGLPSGLPTELVVGYSVSWSVSSKVLVSVRSSPP